MAVACIVPAPIDAKGPVGTFGVPRGRVDLSPASVHGRHAFTFKVCWKCGTPTGSPFSTVASDGWVPWYVNGLLIRGILNVPGMKIGCMILGDSNSMSSGQQRGNVILGNDSMIIGALQGPLSGGLLHLLNCPSSPG